MAKHHRARSKSARYKANDRWVPVEMRFAQRFFKALVRYIMNNPVRTAAHIFLIAIISTIVANALTLQNGRHPSPLYATRPIAHTHKTPSPATTASIPVPKARKRSSQETKDTIATKIDNRDELVLAIQNELADLGFYTQAIDGLIGPQTRDAIMRYQKGAQLPQNGVASEALLSHLRVVAKRGTTTQQVSASTVKHKVKPIARRNKTAEVQAALAQLGYAPGKIDGVIGSSTREAILRFQLDRGLDMSGEISRELITDLEKMLDQPIDRSSYGRG